MDPSSGHPYNQLALLESVRGDKLSALFYYVRSLALQHPFPPARQNLDRMLRKLLTQTLTYKSRSRLTVDEFLLSFLKLQAQIALCVDMDQADQMVKLLSLTLPSLVATETFTVTQLVRMLAVLIYNADCGAHSSRLVVEMAAGMLNACLASSCSLSAGELQSFRYLAIIKLVLDWFNAKTEAPIQLKRSGQLWTAAARLLNELQSGLESAEDDDGKRPLPEDVELLEYSRLQSGFRRASVQRNGVVPVQDEHRIRSVRVIQAGKKLADGGLVLNVTRREETVAEGPEFIFSAPECLLAEESISSEATETSAEPIKEFKILPRPPQRNVALTALMKQTTDDASPVNSATEVHEPPKSNLSSSAASALPPLPAQASGSNFYPRPALPPRLERIKSEQKDRENQQMSRFGLPDTTLPPPLPPPGLGFPLPPPAWSLGGPPPVTQPPVSYSLFNSQTWQPAVGPSSIPPPAHFLPNFNMPDTSSRALFGPAGNSSPAGSLWSGPGPSPLERLLEQQRAMRSSTPGKNSNTPNKPF